MTSALSSAARAYLIFASDIRCAARDCSRFEPHQSMTEIVRQHPRSASLPLAEASWVHFFSYDLNLFLDYVTNIGYTSCILAQQGASSGDDPRDGAGSGVPRLRREPFRGRLGPRPPGVHGLARAVAAASRVPLAEGQRGSVAGKRHGGAPKGVPVAPGRSAPYKRGRRASHARQKEKRVRLSALHPPLGGCNARGSDNRDREKRSDAVR